jgi:aldehyde dehydrogenase (NAD+)
MKAPPAQRGIFMNKLADLMDAHFDELCALEALDNGSFILHVRWGTSNNFLSDSMWFQGKTFNWAKIDDVTASVGCIRYYAGWADKIQGKEIPVGALPRIRE